MSEKMSKFSTISYLLILYQSLEYYIDLTCKNFTSNKWKPTYKKKGYESLVCIRNVLSIGLKWTRHSMFGAFADT